MSLNAESISFSLRLIRGSKYIQGTFKQLLWEGAPGPGAPSDCSGYHSDVREDDQTVRRWLKRWIAEDIAG